MKTVFTLLLSLLFMSAFAQQTFRKSYGAPGYGENARDIIRLKDGSFVAIGSTNHFGAGSYDAFCIRINETGKTLWAKTFGDSSYSDPAIGVATMDGGFVICFSSYKTGTAPGIKYNGMFVVKCNRQGQVLWTKSIKSPSLNTGSVSITPYQVYESKAGDIYVLSEWFSFDYDANYSLAKLDAGGNFKWNSSISLTFTFYLQFDLVGMTEAGNGDIVVCNNNVADYFYTFDDQIQISAFSSKTGRATMVRTIAKNYDNGFYNLSAYNITAKGNALLVEGTYGHDGEGSSYCRFALQPNDRKVTIFYNDFDNKMTGRLATADLRGTSQSSLLSQQNTTSDGGRIYTYNSYDPDYDIIIEKRDSTGRVCTDSIGTFVPGPFDAQAPCPVYTSKDRLLSYVFVAADTSLTVTNVNAEKTLCETFAIASDRQSINAAVKPATTMGMTLYPNPATDRIALTLEASKASDVYVTVVTMQGQTVLSRKLNVAAGKQLVWLDVKTLSPGMYYIKTTGTSQPSVLKFLKQ